MKLIDLIITIFETRWNDKMFVNVYNDYRKFSDFIKEVFQFCYLITQAQYSFGNDLKFALWATNSPSYIAMYIALIIKNIDFYLIPARMKPSLVASIIANSDINILYTSINVSEQQVIDKLKSHPCYKYTFNIESKHFININSKKNLLEFVNEKEVLFDAIKQSEYKVTELRDIILHDFHVKKRDREIAVFSSGSDTVYPKASYFFDDEVYKGLLKLINSNLLPTIEGSTIHSEINFAIAPVWTILWPLYSNCKFAFSNTEAEIVITNTGLFEQHWHYVSKNLYETRILGKLLLKTWFNWLFLILMRCNLKKYFHFGTKKKGIIILNSFLAPRIIKTIVGHLPIYTTYGIQETNQIVTVNNYSTKSLQKENCVGEPFEGVLVSIRENNIHAGEGSLMIMADHFANTVDLEKGVYFDTRDHASLEDEKNTLLVKIYGKIKYAVKNTDHFGSNYENLERILKNVPYFKEILFFSDDDNTLYVFIFPNSDIVEANSFGLIDFHNFVKSYKTLITDVYGIDFIHSIKLTYQDFYKTHDFRIKKAFYHKAVRDDLKNFDVADF